MTVRRMDHVGVVVDDLTALTAFFVALGLELEGETRVEGPSVDRIVGLDDVRSDLAFLRTSDGDCRLELIKYQSPPSLPADPNAPVNAPGIRHLTFTVEDIEAVLARVGAHGAELVGEPEQYEDAYRLCFLRGPEGIIIELVEKLG